jgi:hypothetical protein
MTGLAFADDRHQCRETIAKKPLEAHEFTVPHRGLLLCRAKL